MQFFSKPNLDEHVKLIFEAQFDFTTTFLRIEKRFLKKIPGTKMIVKKLTRIPWGERSNI